MKFGQTSAVLDLSACGGLREVEGDVRGRCGEGSAQTSPARVDGQPDSLCKKEKGTFQPSFHGGIREKKNSCSESIAAQGNLCLRIKGHWKTYRVAC